MTAIIDPKTHRINGTRTTIYHVMEYYLANDPVERVAADLRLTLNEVRAAIAFIEAHQEEVKAIYQKIIDRVAKGNSPETEAKLVKTREKMRAFKAERQALAKTCV